MNARDQSADMPGPDFATSAETVRAEEQRELMRIAAQRLLDDRAAGRRINPEGLAWAEHIVATHKPLGRALGTGEPGTHIAGTEKN